MATEIGRLSQALGIPEATLAHEAVEAWVLAKMAEVDREIARIASAYGASSPDDIEAKIRTGSIEAHPAWEDAIRWEGMEDYRMKLVEALAAGSLSGRDS